MKKVLRKGFFTVIALLLFWVALHHVLSFYEQKKYPAPGPLVEVNGEMMHLSIKGEGPNTIVLLSGLGTASPVLDFEPLVNEMSKNNKVVVVELFGYGWSDETKKQRTVENIVEEIRIALKKANIKGPYILMPHSISGVYTMYYVNQYPNEVKAVIGIDATLPKALEYFHESASTMPKYMGYVAPLGIARLMPGQFLPIAEEGTYSKENIKMTKAISARKGVNKTVVNEAIEIKRNIDKTIKMTYPTDLPLLFFTTKEDKVNKEGKSNVTFYKTQLTNHYSSKIVVLEGHHYLHWTCSKEMSQQVDQFISSL